MLLRKYHIISTFCTSTSSLKWRNRIKENKLITEISTSLLQRKNWIPLLRRFNLSSKLTPRLFIKVLKKTNNNPEISLQFFNWAKLNLGFKPEVKSYCELIKILLLSQLPELSRSLLDDPVIKSVPVSRVLNSIEKTCTSRDSLTIILNFLLQDYSNSGYISDSLEIFSRIRIYGYIPTIHGCNALLDALLVSNEMKLACCFYPTVIRSGIIPDSFTWVLLVRLLCNEGKLINAQRLLSLGVSDVVMYNLVIGCYCKVEDLKVAVDLLNDMRGKNLMPDFSTYSSILDGACKLGDVRVINSTMREMVGMGLLPVMPLSDYDVVIRKFCELGKTYAGKWFFERAQDEKIELPDSSYVGILEALSEEGRVKEAMKVYRVILERKIEVNDRCYSVLGNAICKEEPSEEVNTLLKDIISRGLLPNALDLSQYIAAQCSKGGWQEADDLLNAILEKGFMFDAFCVHSLIEHYCNDGSVDVAIALHDKIEKVGGHLDVASYNVLLDKLCVERRIEEVSRVFDCMRRKEITNSSSFSIMINTLCREKEMRKAMKFHDEMLKKGLKPDDASYKRLISGFT